MSYRIYRKRFPTAVTELLWGCGYSRWPPGGPLPVSPLPNVIIICFSLGFREVFRWFGSFQKAPELLLALQTNSRGHCCTLHSVSLTWTIQAWRPDRWTTDVERKEKKNPAEVCDAALRLIWLVLMSGDWNKKLKDKIP